MSLRSGGLATCAIVLALATMLGFGNVDLTPGAPASILAAPLSQGPDNSIALQMVHPGTGMQTPLFATHSGDGSGRMFVLEKGGKARIIKNGVLNPTPFLDLSGQVSVQSEQGLLGIAFHPEFESNGRFFVFYTALPPPQPTTNVGSNTLAEFHATPGSDVADPNPVQIMLSIPDRAPNHNGGMLAFGLDGYLYISTGDEGAGDPMDFSQSLESLFGKLLRIDVNRPGTPAPPGAGYAIPPENPFSDESTPPAIRKEILAYGFRNPWRYSFDRLTGDIYIGDVGQNAWEEIDFIPRPINKQTARNFGWRVREGNHCYPPGSNCSPAGFTPPIIEYPHAPNSDCSVAGGYRYRGPQFPALRGLYFYGDYCSGKIWKGIESAGGWTGVYALAGNLPIGSFGEDEAGELYLVSLSGPIMHIVQGPPPPTPTITPTPLACDQPARPRVTLQTTPAGAGTLDVLIGVTDTSRVPNNELRNIAVTQIQNALVTLGAQANQTMPFSVPFGPGTRSTHMTVKRVQAGQPMRVNLVVSDKCDAWPTFVGAGPTTP